VERDSLAKECLAQTDKESADNDACEALRGGHARRRDGPDEGTKGDGGTGEVVLRKQGTRNREDDTKPESVSDNCAVGDVDELCDVESTEHDVIFDRAVAEYCLLKSLKACVAEVTPVKVCL
jgi:hypothetical protein